jgi:peroxiredoxin Q/BCP
MRDDYEKFKGRNAEILAIGPNTEASFQYYWKEQNIPYVGLPDPEHRVAVVYRQQVNIFKLGRMPLLCVIDTEGRIRYAHYGSSMSDIPENETLLNVINQLTVPSIR